MVQEKTKPTEAELEILNILWQKEKATVGEIHEILSETKDIGYTTALKIMQIMHEKGMLERCNEKKGKSHIYKAKYKKQETQKLFLNKLIENVFGGSAKKLILQAIGDIDTSKDDLDEIKKYLDSLDEDTKE